MKEITRVVTMELTQIGEFEKFGELRTKENFEKALKKSISGTNVDNVNVLKIQDFILDKEDEQNG